MSFDWLNGIGVFALFLLSLTAYDRWKGDVWHLIIPVAFGGSRRRRTQVAAKMDIDGLVQKELFHTVQELPDKNIGKD